MKNFWFIQISFLILGFVISIIMLNPNKALNFTLGYMSILIPNFLFAVNLKLVNSITNNPSSRLLFFFLGEGFKITLVFMMLLIFSKIFHPVNWFMIIVGLTVSIKAIYILPLLLNKKNSLQFLRRKKK